jgi:hypothetical protein
MQVISKIDHLITELTKLKPQLSMTPKVMKKGSTIYSKQV